LDKKVGFILSEFTICIPYESRYLLIPSKAGFAVSVKNLLKETLLIVLLYSILALSEKLEHFAAQNGSAVVVAHGMVNRELIKIMKKRGWEFCENGKDGYGNLSVNCFDYNIFNKSLE